ncbi:hypothetical protein AWZ03_009959 [Drosophila navojoa]|uniref:Gustatory receptor n=1 Tax=Drosophila navojoa TaxID=7232 RepID=A0A484B4J4_DRONA|nr:putative gustatory receptor 97a [Drosophila navojoa]TDG43608.1 hypothetical protein AWZ03_009959 [Drosophila navojoa]
MQVLKAVRRRIRLLWRLPQRLSNSLTGSQVVLVSVVILIIQNIVYGIFPCRFNFKRKKFVFSLPLAIYSFAVATLFSAYYGRHLWQAYSEKQLTLRDPVQIYSYMFACAAMMNYVTQWAMVPEILRFQNNLDLFETMDYFRLTLGTVAPATVLSGLKLFGCPLLLQLTLIIYQKHTHPELSWLKTIHTMFPIYLGNQLNNCFFGGIVVTRNVLIEINKRLREIQVEVNRLQTPLEMMLHKHYYRMRRFCDLADRLDELASKYTVSTSSSMDYLDLTAFSMVTYMAINLTNTTLGIYTQYQAFADFLMLDISYEISRALAHLVFLVIPMADIYVLARVCQQVIDEANETGNLLQRISLQHSDVRFNQVVDALWLEVKTIRYQLVPMGLLELDGALFTMIFSTVSGFLLFLIQNDLTQRFSLK